MMFIFVLIMFAVLVSAFLQRFRRPRQFWWIGLLSIFFSAWLSFYASAHNWGVEKPMKQGESIRQDSTQSTYRRGSYFGYYSSRSHMGGGLMGGK